MEKNIYALTAERQLRLQTIAQNKDYKQMNTQLSKNFSFLEMTITENRKFLSQNRQVPEKLVESGIQLCQTLLQPIRDHYGKPLVVHSGYRCPALNKAIGGSATSQHCKFEACDFHIIEVSLTGVFNWIRLKSGLKWGQLILEGWSMGHPSWIHISLGEPYRDPSKCQQVMTFDGKKYKFL